MRQAQLFALSLCFVQLACASSSRSIKLQRLALKGPHCSAVPARRYPPQFASLGLDSSFASGAPTITQLDMFRKTVVLVNDNYYDPQRIEPARMLAAIVDSLADFSNGALRVDGRTLVASSGDRWAIPTPDSIWQIPLAVRDLGERLVTRLPAQHPLAKGAFAEVLATNALLSTLDPYSMLLPPGALSSSRNAESVGGASLQKLRDAAIAADVASATLPDGILHLRIGPFLPQTPGLIRAALEKTSGTSGVILDLRGNRGGTVEATAQIIDLFVPSGTMLILNGRNSAEAKVAADDRLPSEHLKMIVLVDSLTSSGGEMVAGALRFGDRAILLGARTSGNALVQVLYEYRTRDTNELSGLSLSIAEAVLPGERVFEGVGIAPDVEVTSASERSGRAVPGCAPIGEKLATIRYDPSEADPTVALSSRIITLAPTAARADLLAAAKSIAASARQLSASFESSPLNQQPQ